MEKLSGIQDFHCTDQELRNEQDQEKEHRYGETVACAEGHTKSHMLLRAETNVTQDAVESTGHLVNAAKGVLTPK